MIIAWLCIIRRDFSNLSEASLTEVQEVDVTATTEAVLLSLEDAATQKVLLFLLDREVHVRVNHVLELIGTGHLALLVDLVDDHRNVAGLFTVVSDHLETADCSTRRLIAVRVFLVIKTLERVDDHDKAFARVLLANFFGAFKKLMDRCFVTADKAMLKFEALRSHSSLEERLFGSIEETDVTLLGKSISNSQHHGSLTSTRFAREESDAGRCKTMTAASSVEVVKARGDLDLEVSGDFDVEDVRAEFDVCDVFEVHVGYSRLLVTYII